MEQRIKFKLIGVDENSFKEALEQYVADESMQRLSSVELESTIDIIDKNIELEIEPVRLEENEGTMACYDVLDGKLIVVKRKRINLQLLFKELQPAINFGMGDEFAKVLSVLQFIMIMFVQKLDEDASLIYSWIARKYFNEGILVENTQIYEEINTFLKTQFNCIWPEKKIDQVLDKIVDAGVAEWKEGYFWPLDRVIIMELFEEK